jgi:alkaline phosphatase
MFRVNSTLKKMNLLKVVSDEPDISTLGPTVDYPEENPFWSQTTNENNRKYWQMTGQQTLREHLARKLNENKAKNLIILVADGMSIPTQMATRVFMGGEEKVLSFERFPYVGLAKVKKQKRLLI